MNEILDLPATTSTLMSMTNEMTTKCMWNIQWFVILDNSPFDIWKCTFQLEEEVYSPDIWAPHVVPQAEPRHPAKENSFQLLLACPPSYYSAHGLSFRLSSLLTLKFGADPPVTLHLALDLKYILLCPELCQAGLFSSEGSSCMEQHRFSLL